MEIKRKKEHFDWIIEMTKTLFPKYTNVKWGKNWDSNEIWFYDENNNSHEIDWFQFCFINIRKALKIHYDDFYRTNLGINQEIHFVDFLYEEFQKLNNLTTKKLLSMEEKGFGCQKGFEGCDQYKNDNVCRCY